MHEASEEIVDGKRIASSRGQQASRERQRAEQVRAISPISRPYLAHISLLVRTYHDYPYHYH